MNKFIGLVLVLLIWICGWLLGVNFFIPQHNGCFGLGGYGWCGVVLLGGGFTWGVVLFWVVLFGVYWGGFVRGGFVWGGLGVRCNSG